MPGFPQHGGAGGSYTPASSSPEQWDPVPDTYASALDQIAARLASGQLGATSEGGFAVTPGTYGGAYITYNGNVWFAIDGPSGCTTSPLLVSQYPVTPWNTQAQGLGAAGPQYLGAMQGATLTGPAAAGVLTFQPFITALANSCSVQSCDLVLQGRVVSTTGATEAEGDAVIIRQTLDVVVVLGLPVALYSGAQVVNAYNASTYPAPGTMAGTTLSVAITAGTIQFTVTTGPGLDPSTEVDFSLFTDPQIKST